MRSDDKNPTQMEPFELPVEIRAKFASYREATPDPEASAQFMPQLWSRIDSRRSLNFSFGRLAKGFVSVALASCLGMSLLFLTPVPQISPIYSATYLDALAADHGDDAMIDVELSHAGETL
jgi:hypothetical protein